MKASAILSRQGNIALLSFSQPPHNYIQEPEFIAPETLLQLEEDNTTHALVIHGMGRHFSAGANPDQLRLMAADKELLLHKMQKGAALLNAIGNLRLPVIAAISGLCFGGGLEIALACHIRIAAPNTLFAFPEANLNLMPGLGGIYRMANRCGTANTLIAALAADTLNAVQAQQKNLADIIAPGNNVLDFAVHYAEKLIAGRPKHVIMSIMQALNNAARLPAEKALEEETKLFCNLAFLNNKDE